MRTTLFAKVTNKLRWVKVFSLSAPVKVFGVRPPALPSKKRIVDDLDKQHHQHADEHGFDKFRAFLDGEP